MYIERASTKELEEELRRYQRKRKDVQSQLKCIDSYTSKIKYELMLRRNRPGYYKGDQTMNETVLRQAYLKAEVERVRDDIEETICKRCHSVRENLGEDETQVRLWEIKDILDEVFNTKLSKLKGE